MANSVPKIDFVECPFITPPPPIISLMAGDAAKVRAALRERTGVVYMAHHDVRENMHISLGMDPGDNPFPLEDASRTLGPPTWVALLQLDDPVHRQGLLALLHKRLRIVGFTALDEAPILPPFALLQYAGLRAWAGATLVALTSLGFLPRSISPVALLTGLDTSRILDIQQDYGSDSDLWQLGEDIRAVRLDDGWGLLAGSRIANARRFAQEPERCTQIQEDIFTGVVQVDGLTLQVPLKFDSLDDIADYAVGDQASSWPWTHVRSGNFAKASANRDNRT